MKKAAAMILLLVMALASACGKPLTPLDQARERYLADRSLAAEEGCFVETYLQVTAGQEALERFAEGKTDTLRLVYDYGGDALGVYQVTRDGEGYLLQFYDSANQLVEERYPYLHYGVCDKPSGINGTSIPYVQYSFCALSEEQEYGPQEIDQVYKALVTSDLSEAPAERSQFILWLESRRIDPRKSAGS